MGWPDLNIDKDIRDARGSCTTPNCGKIFYGDISMHLSTVRVDTGPWGLTNGTLSEQLIRHSRKSGHRQFVLADDNHHLDLADLVITRDGNDVAISITNRPFELELDPQNTAQRSRRERY